MEQKLLNKMTIDDISEPIKKHIDEFNKYFKGLLKTDVALLNLILRYVASRKGKQVRPMFVFLAAELCGGISQRTYVGAGMVELLHTATLIHDDVVDGAKERRGIASINSQWNNKIAILIGDFLLAKGLLTSVDHSEYKFLQVSSKAIKRMSEGELLSIEKSRTLRVDEEVYYKITSGKTASLIASCCEMGACSATDDAEKHLALETYGEMVGIAFQIKDDIFDFTSSSSKIGKPVGNDLKEKKITLPLIHALSKTDKGSAKKIVAAIKKGDLSADKIKEIIDFTIDKGGVEYAREKAYWYVEKAIEALNIFEDCAAKKSLIGFANYVVSRDK